MKQGKLSNERLESLILSKFGHTRAEVVCSPGIGVDCAAVDLSGRLAVLSCDPITSAKDVYKRQGHGKAVSAEHQAQNHFRPYFRQY